MLAPLRGDERALDVGCGTGALAYVLAPLVGEVVGVDSEEEYIAAAREGAPANCTFEVGDAESLPFSYGDFDLVGCSASSTTCVARSSSSPSSRGSRTRRGDPAGRPARRRRPASEPRAAIDSSACAMPRTRGCCPTPTSAASSRRTISSSAANEIVREHRDMRRLSRPRRARGRRPRALSFGWRRRSSGRRRLLARWPRSVSSPGFGAAGDRRLLPPAAARDRRYELRGMCGARRADAQRARRRRRDRELRDGARDGCLRPRARRRRRSRLSRSSAPATPPARRTWQHPNARGHGRPARDRRRPRGSSGRARDDPGTRVRRLGVGRRAMTERREGAAVERKPAPCDDRRRQRQGEPLPAFEPDPRDHPE